MKREEARAHCLSLPGVTADYPFGPEVQVFRVGGKLFALLSEVEHSVSLKCDPGLAEILRSAFAAIRPGYHLNKRHWNTVTLDGSVPDEQLTEMIAHSYDLVLSSLPKKAQAAIRAGSGTS
ncbi:MAG TPA: MmcQ/YjbR family DNA-binding protein [Dehalococcoidia bacterium]|nr:MmcQ/YjbR family DNA-binding protein [Dehalococcoidia bacterium]